ncbi:MFS transporter [Vibrio sp. PP-XX7]
MSHILSHSGIAHSDWVVWGIFALRFLIRPLGGLIVGRVADQQGRKKALIITSSLTGTATLMMSVLPVHFFGEGIVVVLLLLQMVQAFSFGGEYPTIILYLHQESAAKEQSRISSLIVASSIVGVIVSVLIMMGLKALLIDRTNGILWLAYSFIGRGCEYLHQLLVPLAVAAFCAFIKRKTSE